MSVEVQILVTRSEFRAKRFQLFLVRWYQGKVISVVFDDRIEIRHKLMMAETVVAALKRSNFGRRLNSPGSRLIRDIRDCLPNVCVQIRCILVVIALSITSV